MIDVSLLAELPLFSSLQSEVLGEIAASLQLMDVPEGNIFIKEDEPGNTLSIIVEGVVEVIKSLGTPGERLLAMRGPGEFLGEMSLLEDRGKRTASVRARTPVQLVVLSRDKFDTLVRERPDFSLRLLRELVHRLRESEIKTIQDLEEKNRLLTAANLEIKAAQAQLIEQERIQHELRMARQIQESILPKTIPQLPGWKINLLWQPARQVGGDFYDFNPLNPGFLGLFAGDVAGKGVPASLGMATTHSVLRLVSRGKSTPGRLMRRMNHALQDNHAVPMYVTAIYILIDLTSGEFLFSNAGHPYPILSHQGKTRLLRLPGIPLGTMRAYPYSEGQGLMLPGDRLLIYSDGVSEAHDQRGDMFQEDRLLSLFDRDISGEEWISLVTQEMERFRGKDQEQEDDITMISLERCYS